MSRANEATIRAKARVDMDMTADQALELAMDLLHAARTATTTAPSTFHLSTAFANTGGMNPTHFGGFVAFTVHAGR